MPMQKLLKCHMAVISVSDTVGAGQKAVMQRELQNLNTVWQNYTSLGGSIAEGADAPVAVRALMVGTDLSGVSFQGLTLEPSYVQSMGGERFVLAIGMYLLPSIDVLFLIAPRDCIGHFHLFPSCLELLEGLEGSGFA
jgi:hypothetical protein